MRGLVYMAVLGCLFVQPALAGSPLQGEWKGTLPGVPGYVSTTKVDAEGRTIMVDDDGRAARGYVARVDSVSAEFVVTERGTVSRIQCSIQSRDLLHCHGRYTTGEAYRSMLILTRTERPAPKNLTATTR